MKTRCFRQVGIASIIALCSAVGLRADSVTFSLLPPNGNVSGTAASLVGWGYSLTNNSSADWFVSTNLSSDSFANGTPTLLFDFPSLAPGATVTEPFDAVNSTGLYELLWDSSAPGGFTNSGNFVLSGQWWTGDPSRTGTYLADATDVALPYEATVTPSTSTIPEPSQLPALALGLATLTILRDRKSVV